MSLKRAHSIFFLQDVRLGMASGGAHVTRVSLVRDKRYEVWVDQGIEAEIRDPMLKTVVRVPWHIVRDYILEADVPTSAEDKPKPEAVTVKHAKVA